MNENKKLMSGLKSKLVAAICMLLVAVIMVVSSTYAWFTLSTAPEVTGITTNVGANGALEMLLLTVDASGKPVYGSGTSSGITTEDNLIWGNLVNVADESYGLQNITIMPSKFVAEGADGKIIPSAILQTPVYGADGRVSQIQSNAYSGTFDAQTGVFSINSKYGVRAVGVASGMTERQIAFRNSRSNAANAANDASSIIAKSLQDNGSALASLALKISLNAGATCTTSDIDSLELMIADLNRAVAKVEVAYQYLFIAVAASSKVSVETAYQTIEAMFEQGKTLTEVLATLKTEYSITGIDTIESYITSLDATKANILTASDKVETLTTESNSADVKGALKYLLNTDSMTFCTYTVEQLTGASDPVAMLTPHMNNLKLEITSGGGVYADIADHCGSYDAEITLKDVSYGDIPLDGLPINMAVSSNEEYLQKSSAAVAALGAPQTPSSETSSQPISEFYGYIIDLAFRTNASGSDLLLQTDAIDRIYEDNQNPETQGSGSSMTFAAVSGSGLSDQQVKNLMKCFRIVIFSPNIESDENTGTILAYAKLDVDNAVFSADGWTAKMYLCDDTGAISVDKKVITSLEQNVEANVSVLVYLDGETLQNSDVAATTTKSITGKMNIQFASSAELKPAENGSLHQTGANATAAPSATEAPEAP